MTRRLVLLPGLGAKAPLFEPQRAAFPDLIVPDWLDPRRNETLAEYSARMAETIGAGSGDLFLGGVSFGGPVALEMARLLKPKAVFMIGGFRSPRAIPRLFRGVLRAARPAPAPMLNLLKGLAPLATPLFAPLNASERQFLIQIIRECDPRFFTWGGYALTQWPGVEHLEVPVQHIHGAEDRIIPASRVQADVIVPAAGHLLNVTHADVVNRFIGERIDSALSRNLPQGVVRNGMQ